MLNIAVKQTSVGHGRQLAKGTFLRVLAAVLGVAMSARAASDSRESPAAFDIPIWHEDARWEIEKFAGCDTPGILDGPRQEMPEYSVGDMATGYRPFGGGPYRYSSYDPATERGHMVAGSAQGYLDGPFSRARFGGWSYSTRSLRWLSPDRRYLFITDGHNSSVLRCLDYKKQEVRTLLPEAQGVLGVTADRQGRAYALLDNNGTLAIIDPEGETSSGPKLEMQQTIRSPGWGCSMVVDEVRNRLYATTFRAEKWYVWYWDLADGSFHGVVPILDKRRGRNVGGSFDGVDLYGEGRLVGFGPDDPENRFLYMGRVDTWTVFRLDLKERRIAAMTANRARRGEPQEARFVEGSGPGRVPFYGGGIIEGHNFISSVHSPRNAWRLRRIR